MLAEKFKIVPIADDLDFNADAYTDCINMKNYHKATFILMFHTLGGNDGHVWVYSGAADATYSSAIEYRYAFGGAAVGAASCDVLTALTANPGGSTPTALHITNATYSDYMVIIEVDAAHMDMANQEEWLSIGILDTDGGATGTVTGFAILEPRYTKSMSPTALV